MCFHPKSNVTLPRMTLADIGRVVDAWVDQFQELSQRYAWVQVFENKGAVMGCSNPHPHCQIWASSFMPNEAKLKDDNLRNYFQKHGVNMLLKYAQSEIQVRKTEMSVFALERSPFCFVSAKSV